MLFVPEPLGAFGVLYFEFDFTLPSLCALVRSCLKDLSLALSSLIPNIFAFVLVFRLAYPDLFPLNGLSCLGLAFPFTDKSINAIERMVCC